MHMFVIVCQKNQNKKIGGGGSSYILNTCCPVLKRKKLRSKFQTVELVQYVLLNQCLKKKSITEIDSWTTAIHTFVSIYLEKNPESIDCIWRDGSEDYKAIRLLFNYFLTLFFKNSNETQQNM